MNRRRSLAATLVLALIALLLGLPASVGASGTGGAGRGSARSNAVVSSRPLRVDPRKVRAYWTKERMRQARPADVLVLPGGPKQPAGSRERVSDSTARFVRATPAKASATSPDPGATLCKTDTKPYPYNRCQVTVDYTTVPYATSGKVFFRDLTDRSNYECSATALTSANSSVVWTAGHCVHGGPGYYYAHNWVFVPAYRDGNAPLGKWVAHQFFAPSEWVNHANPKFDVAAVAVSPDIDGNRLVDRVGGRGIVFRLDDFKQHFHAFGYPAQPPFTGERMFMCDSSFARTDDPDWFSGPATIGIGCDMNAGSSGGGWVIHDEFVNSNVSYAYERQPEVLYGPYLGVVAEQVFNDASSADVTAPRPSITHEMTVSLRLRRHLVAKGRVTAQDAYIPCARTRPVKIFRKTPSGWVFLKRAWTDLDGRYRVPLADRTGRYRVLAPRRTIDDLNRCSADLSPTKRHLH